MTSRSMQTAAVVIASLLFAHFAGSYSAQTSRDAAKAVKFDEFGDIQYSDKIARLDNFAIQLQNLPDAKAFIVVYRTRRHLPGLSSRLAGQMRNYLVYTRAIQAIRIVTIDGGTASNLFQELWIAPAGTTPIPRVDAYLPSLPDTEAATKFDEYFIGSYEECDYCYGGDSLDAFAAELRRQASALGYVIYYPQYRVQRWEEFNDRGRLMRAHRQVYQDSQNHVRLAMATLKAELEKTHGISSSRIQVVNGGFRRWREIELWMVPRGARPPIKTPNAFPGLRKRNGSR